METSEPKPELGKENGENSDELQGEGEWSLLETAWELALMLSHVHIQPASHPDTPQPPAVLQLVSLASPFSSSWQSSQALPECPPSSNHQHHLLLSHPSPKYEPGLQALLDGVMFAGPTGGCTCIHTEVFM